MARLTVDQMLVQARSRLARITAAVAYLAVSGSEAVLVDVRTPDNRARDGRLPDALEIPLNVLEWRLDPASSHRHPRAPSLDDLVIVICEQGYSSSLAAARLQDLGFSRATDVIGGFEGWEAAGLPVIRHSEARTDLDERSERARNEPA